MIGGTHPDRIVQIQVKDKVGSRSKSFTVHNMTINDAFAHIYFLFEQMHESPEEEVRIIHHKGGQHDQTAIE